MTVRKVDIFFCNFCGKEIPDDFNGAHELDTGLHLHDECEADLPPWVAADGSNSIRWFFEAMDYAKNCLEPRIHELSLLNFLHTSPLMNTDFILFIDAESGGAWICRCNNLLAVVEIWKSLRDASIEGAWHKGLFRKIEFKVTPQMEEP